MARFQDLSTELVLGILEKVLPGDIESVSLASKSIYWLAIPRLEEHRRLRGQYTNFQDLVEYKPPRWRDAGGHLADLLCEIMSDARIGHYVKLMDLNLRYASPRKGWKPDAVYEKRITRSRTRLQQDSKTSMEIIEEAIRATELIPTEEVDDWLDQIRSGNEDPLAALLLLHVPNLHTLRFTDSNTYWAESSYLLKMIQRVGEQGSAVKPYLSQLKNVSIIYDERIEKLDLVKAFMSLPFLTSIKTNCLIVDGRAHEANSAILPQPSNVKELSFRSGLVPEQALSELLGGVKTLKSFAYDFTTLWRYENEPTFDCITLMKSLEANASHTLEHLRLSALDIDPSGLAPLRGFHALRGVEFHTVRCLAVEASNGATLIGALPASIESLDMRWGDFTSDEKLKEAFVGLVRESKIQLPHLRTLRVSPAHQEQSDTLFNCLASNETAQLNKMLSFDIQGRDGGGEIPAWVDKVCTCGEDCFGDDSH
ncbi:hypothetical protein HO173_011058 [Letharia columbiana]|uniref:F-box domain-containing protein n=1 Tax=Letharia columbiana TaxID=112416 RepID=A0A8H6FLF2_9LECA|nr:uncharacterized protein HO173_011058 [Letharia columbiana]KAF6230706.1 hypothetical protein HO173_011058 [Letharia columbiana]